LKPHILHWKGRKPDANVEALAREARYRLIGEWAKKHRISAIILAHTEDDQGETFLLRLARGSGVDGLSAMRPRGIFPFGEGPEILRPLLSFSRDELRALLRAGGISWLEDPMNTQNRYARARLRAIWPQLKAVGLTPARIAGASAHLARARQALEDATRDWLGRFARETSMGAAFDPSRLVSVPREIGLRALSALLVGVSGYAYRPRFESLERLYDEVSSAGFTGATLMGCRIARAPKASRVFGAATVIIAPELPRKAAKSVKKQPRSRERGGRAKPAP
jgi:tRNA(Ile)-lysidine synthase